MTSLQRKKEFSPSSQMFLCGMLSPVLSIAVRQSQSGVFWKGSSEKQSSVFLS